MVKSLKANWRALKASRPGRRFQDRYDRRKKSGQGSALGRILNLVLALLLFSIGIVLMVIPGPAILFFFVSGSLLATESRFVAAGLDALELKLRAGWRWARRHWRELTLAGKAALGGLAIGTAGAFAYGAYRLFLAQ